MNDSHPDDRLLDDLRATASSHDDLPPAVIDAARAAFTWRTIDAELAELATLTFDSDAADRDLAGVRGTVDARMLSFESPGAALDLEITVERDAVRLAGQLLPATAATVLVDAPSGTTEHAADADGHFDVRLVTAGPVRVRVSSGSSPLVRTEWITL